MYKYSRVNILTTVIIDGNYSRNLQLHIKQNRTEIQRKPKAKVRDFLLPSKYPRFSC